MRPISKTKFLEAIESWDADAVAAALRERPDFVSILDKTHRTPLHLCARITPTKTKKSPAAIATAKALIKAGADVNAVQPIPDDGEIFPATALWYSLAHGRNRLLASFLLKNEAEPNHCMFALVYADDLASAKLVRRYGSRIDDVFAGETPLIYAVRHSRAAFAKWLLTEGANANLRDRRGFTALHHAVRRRLSDDTLRALVKAGADPKSISDDGTAIAKLATRSQRALLGVDISV
ncbi:MAG TPA: ankyrin repeat domain-containing protein [Steroidobacteraceae bacterium]|nr:ankyrin repeat domain-containing protein [Steroidobacteraceae bacterium]